MLCIAYFYASSDVSALIFVCISTPVARRGGQILQNLASSASLSSRLTPFLLSLVVRPPSPCALCVCVAACRSRGESLTDCCCCCCTWTVQISSLFASLLFDRKQRATSKQSKQQPPSHSHTRPQADQRLAIMPLEAVLIASERETHTAADSGRAEQQRALFLLPLLTPLFAVRCRCALGCACFQH